MGSLVSKVLTRSPSVPNQYYNAPDNYTPTPPTQPYGYQKEGSGQESRGEQPVKEPRKTKEEKAKPRIDLDKTKQQSDQQKPQQQQEQHQQSKATKLQEPVIFTTTFEAQVDAAPPHAFEENFDDVDDVIEIDTNLYTPEVEDAVVKIQAGIRGYLTRKSLKERQKTNGHVHRKLTEERVNRDAKDSQPTVVPPPSNFQDDLPSSAQRLQTYREEVLVAPSMVNTLQQQILLSQSKNDERQVETMSIRTTTTTTVTTTQQTNVSLLPIADNVIQNYDVVSPPSPSIQIDPIQQANGSVLDENEAAIKIQAAFRGYHARKTLSRDPSPSNATTPDILGYEMTEDELKNKELEQLEEQLLQQLKDEEQISLRLELDKSVGQEFKTGDVVKEEMKKNEKVIPAVDDKLKEDKEKLEQKENETSKLKNVEPKIEPKKEPVEVVHFQILPGDITFKSQTSVDLKTPSPPAEGKEKTFFSKEEEQIKLEVADIKEEVKVETVRKSSKDLVKGEELSEIIIVKDDQIGAPKKETDSRMTSEQQEEARSDKTSPKDEIPSAVGMPEASADGNKTKSEQADPLQDIIDVADEKEEFEKEKSDQKLISVAVEQQEEQIEEENKDKQEKQKQEEPRHKPREKESRKEKKKQKQKEHQKESHQKESGNLRERRLQHQQQQLKEQQQRQQERHEKKEKESENREEKEEKLELQEKQEEQKQQVGDDQKEKEPSGRSTQDAPVLQEAVEQVQQGNEAAAAVKEEPKDLKLIIAEIESKSQEEIKIESDIAKILSEAIEEQALSGEIKTDPTIIFKDLKQELAQACRESQMGQVTGQLPQVQAKSDDIKFEVLQATKVEGAKPESNEEMISKIEEEIAQILEEDQRSQVNLIELYAPQQEVPNNNQQESSCASAVSNASPPKAAAMMTPIIKPAPEACRLELTSPEVNPCLPSPSASTPEELLSTSPDDEVEAIGTGLFMPVPVRASSPNPFGRKRRKGKKGQRR